MRNYKTLEIIQRLEYVSRSLARKWGKPEEWQDIYSDMCCAFLKKFRKMEGKPLAYIIKACKNEAINNYFCGKSICSKPREGLVIVSIDGLCERIPSGKRFEQDLHMKILVEKLFLTLTKREKQVATLIMKDYTEQEMARILCVSQQRINRIKMQIRQKMKKLFHARVVI